MNSVRVGVMCLYGVISVMLLSYCLKSFQFSATLARQLGNHNPAKQILLFYTTRIDRLTQTAKHRTSLITHTQNKNLLSSIQKFLLYFQHLFQGIHDLREAKGVVLT